MHADPSRRLAALVGAGLLLSLGTGPVLAAAPAGAATGAAPAVQLEGEACPEGEGATVLVDPQDLGGGDLPAPRAGCALEAPDGLTALTEAGFSATESQPGFVCSIERVPAPEQADCTTDGYWAYFSAPRDGEWTASDVGAADRVPEVGGVEAWSWTDLSGGGLEGAAPRVPPAAVAALPVAAAAAPAEPSATASATASPDASAPAPSAPASSAPAPSATASPEASASATAEPDAGAAEASATDPADRQVPVVTIVVIAVLAVLLVAGIVVGGRRRRHQVEQELDERRSDAR